MIMCFTHNKKRQKTNNRRNLSTQSKKNHRNQRKGKWQVLGNTGSGYYQANKERKNKRVS